MNADFFNSPLVMILAGVALLLFFAYVSARDKAAARRRLWQRDEHLEQYPAIFEEITAAQVRAIEELPDNADPKVVREVVEILSQAQLELAEAEKRLRADTMAVPIMVDDHAHYARRRVEIALEMIEASKAASGKA